MRNYIITFFIGVLLTLGAANVSKNTPISLGGDIGVSYYSTATNASSTVATTSRVIVNANVARQYLAIVNDGDQDVYLNFRATSTAGTGIRLNANGGAYEMDITSSNVYVGPVSAVTSTSTSAVTIIEK